MSVNVAYVVNWFNKRVQGMQICYQLRRVDEKDGVEISQKNDGMLIVVMMNI